MKRFSIGGELKGWKAAVIAIYLVGSVAYTTAHLARWIWAQVCAQL